MSVYLFPASVAQESLWLADRFDPGNPAYNVPAAARLTGPLDAAAFASALQDVVDRHEALRTTFRVDGDDLTQVVHESLRVACPVTDVSTREIHRFDLTRGPLLRAELLRLGPEEHVLLLTLHHIVADGASVGVLLAELGAAYLARRAGHAPELPELPFQYADYAVWHREQVAGERVGGQLPYWRDRFASRPEPLELPWDRPRPPAPTHTGHRVTTLLDAGLTAQLDALASSSRASLFMVLATAYAALLRRHTDQPEVVIGTPVANRTSAATEALIGYFVNLVALRLPVPASSSFAELLGVTREHTLGALANAEVPFDTVVSAVRQDHDTRRSPLFQAMFALQNAFTGPIELPGLRVELLENDSGTAKYDVNLLVERRGAELHVALEVNADVLDRASAQRLLTQYGELLTAAAAAPDTAVADLPIGDTSTLVGSSATDTTPVAERILAQACRTPDAVAVRDAEGTLTYAELVEQSRRIAGGLRARGVGPGDLVAIGLRRGRPLLPALLGIWLAGAGYVPVEPSLPAVRRERILAAARPVVELTDETLPELLATPPVAAMPTDPDGIAYVLFTSGSTGVPKGVRIPHSGLANYLGWALDAYGLRAGDAAPVQSPLGFDFTLTPLLTPLLAGGEVVLLDEADGVEGLGRLLADRSGFGLMKLTPAHLEVLLRTVPEERLRTACRVLVVGGDALPPALARRWLRVAPDTRLVNEYGPTEAVVGCCVHEVSEVDTERTAIPIGRPVAGTTLSVMADGRPVADGAVGELWVGGNQVAAGYLDDPERTAEKFVDGGRLYRTGDRVRRLATGDLEYLGRSDRQLKIRGYRVEPGEVEAALLDHPTVREAVVVPTGQDGLAGYVAGGEPAELRAFLSTRLPAYLVPDVLVSLPALPLTVNGKVDLAALPDPGTHRPRATYEPPRPGTEQAVAEIWSEVLGVPEPGRADDFVRLGGHSLSLTRVVSRLRDRFGVELGLRQAFEHSTLAALAALVDATPHSTSRATGEASVDLSFAQQRLWFLDQLTPGDPTYHVPVALRLRGAMDRAALSRAVEGLAARHEALRTSFHTKENGDAITQVADAVPLPVEFTDLSGLAPDDALRECDRMARAQAVKPFDLTTAPLLRVELVRLAEHDHVLLVTIHHIVSDGWSVGVLLRDFAALYTGHDLPPLTHRYADHTRWQRARLDGGALDDQLAYWHDQLRGLPVLTLPTDRSRQTHGPRHGGQLTGTLSVRSTVEGLAARLGVTPFAVLLAAFYATLHHYTGQQDLAVASPVAQRTRREVEDLVGCFVNVLVLREQVNPAEEFTALVRRVAATNLDAQTNQDVPYERLADGGDGLAQAMFGLQNVPAGELSLPGLAVEELPVDTGTARFDLTLLLEPRAGEYGTRLEYDAGMLDRATAERILASYRTLLSAALTEPGRPVGALPVLTAAERAEALLAGHGPHLPVPNQTVTDLFADVVRRRPNAPAVQDATGTLTYAELDARVTHVANRLRARGAGRNTPVALLLGRGQDFLTAILAVFRAGAAYLPLDPQHPVERQLAILTSSGAPLLIHDESALAKRAPVPALRLTDLLAEPTTPTTPATPTTRDLAYVIYTSGSTGVPKGAMVEQAGMVNHLLAKVVDLSLGPDDVVVQNAPVCFDISVWQYLAPLLVGGRVWVATDDQARDPRQLWQGAAHAGATVLEVVPSLLRAALTEPDLAAVPTLRCLMVTGEALPPDLVGDWLGRRPDVPVVNAYGPTECSDDVTHAILRAPLPAGTVHAPIGSPVANLRLYVLDPHGEPVPVGVAGELFVGGIGVGRGYLGDPTKTAERFVPDPFGPSGTRLYRTGDRVRRRADGSLEFLGRVDHQVKVRGHRIEPGEIEVALRAHPAVDDCVVTAVDDRLAAYVTGSGQPTELRDHLAARLPEYMVPAAFTTLDALPLTPNGKVDRATLPAPVWAETAAYVEPRTDLERAIAQAWAEVLEVPRVGAHDSFFALGGHSLLAVRAAAVLRARLAHDVPVRALFDTPTPAGLAAVLETRETVTHEPIPVAADREVLSFAQQRMWFFEQREPGTAVFIMPGGYRIRGALDVDRLATALTEVVARHEVLRTTYQDRDGVGVASVEPAEPVALPVHDLRGTDQDVAEHAREESTTPFDLSQAPMVRARLLRLADEDWLLLVTVHHLAADGGSVAILLDEVLAGYAGREIAPPPVQYADFAAWQRERTTGDLGRTQLAYWREQLAGDPPVLQLPTDRPRQERREYRGELVTTTVPAELATRLRALAGDRDGTLFMVLLAAFQFVAHRWSGERDVVVGIPVDGRDHEQLARLVGCFINTLPIRTQIQDGNPSELIDQVRGTVLDALANQDVPFQAIVAELRDSFAGFDVLFNMLDPHDALAGSTVDGLTVTPFGDELTFGAKFDLTVYARDLGADGISIMAIHDAALFDQARITELLNQYLKVLDAFAADTRLEDITLATSVIPAEPRIEWAGSVVDRLVAHAAATPDAPAVGDRYTYAELDAATRQVAAHLVTQGVSPGDVVAIHAHRTAGLVAAVLGVMRAGAVFTLVDPAYPPAARAERVELAGAVLELDPSEIPAADDDFPPVPVDPDAPAYLTFTSGTTGKPRMVAASPRPLTHFLAWHTEKWGFGPTDRFSALSGVAHDPFLRDILTPVWCGASVHLPDTETVRDPDRLAAWLAGHEITVTHLTPSVARLLAAADETHRLPRLRHAFFGGEVATGADGTRLAARAPGVTCVNFYGATETPQAMAYHVLQDEPGPVPLGHGIDGVRLLVERAPGRPAGIGELGEIVVATPYLSLGYPLEPELTARRFGPGTYRTGDLGRYRPDGAVVFAGRADRQASVRGHRVEPAEIEAVLAAHPAVRQVHVDTSDGLTAYVVGTVTPGWLADRLPEHLIPAVVALPALPLTPNGKLDRAALAPSTVVDPRTDAEHAVYAIWRDVLPDRRFGVTDDFFVAGGHSLAAGQIMARVRKEFGVDLPLAALFEANTVAALAERVEEAILAQLDEMTDDEIIALSQREAS